MPTRTAQLAQTAGRPPSQLGPASSDGPPVAAVLQGVFPSELGWMGLTAHRGSTGELAIGRLTFGHETAAAAGEALRSAQTRDQRSPEGEDPTANGPPSGDSAETSVIPATWLTDLQAFAAGTPTDLSHLPLDLSYLTDFGRRVAMACRQVAWGETISYGQLATRIGSPGAARAVGAVMARNRHPLIIPCHRVLASNGALTGFSAPQGLIMKQRLLAHEEQG